ncbi:hypothetical protein ACFZC7_35415 [Streptomyces massasporeus]|uniref:hypothetical protein n=1 Tax=Streptomyces massasporeus TaxID=67324 RepID=UPI0036EC36BE
MTYKMTDDFATTMVTVIPVILLVGTAEVVALARTKWDTSWDDPTSGTPARRLFLWCKQLAKAVLHVIWGSVVLAQTKVEVDLIKWLALPDRSDDPTLAREVVDASRIGFYFIAGIALFLIFVRLLNSERVWQWASETLGLTEPQEPAEDTPTAPPRRQVRHINPAHRAVRHPRQPPRRTRSTPGRWP